MKKNYLLCGCLLLSLSAYSQVGINTTTPQSTFDVTGAPTDAAKLDGILAPRITGVQLRAKNYTNAQQGALVYVSTADTAPEGQTVNVTSSGYYFFNGTIWVKINSGIGTFDTTDDAFVNNAASTRVELGTNSNGSTTRTAGTEFVIKDNGHVGINITNPISALQVMENSSLGSNELRMSSANTPPYFIADRFKASGNLTDGDELGRFVFNAKIAGGSFPVAGIHAFYNGSGTTNLSSIVFRTSDSPKMILDASGNLGIGADPATAKIDVNGTARIRSLTNATTNTTYDRNVVADANGNLGYSNVVVPSDASGSVAINAAPVNVCTNCFLTQVVPVITVLQTVSRLSPPSYNFAQSGNNITLDFQSSTNDSTQVTYTVLFVRK